MCHLLGGDSDRVSRAPRDAAPWNILPSTGQESQARLPEWDLVGHWGKAPMAWQIDWRATLGGAGSSSDCQCGGTVPQFPKSIKMEREAVQDSDRAFAKSILIDSD